MKVSRKFSVRVQFILDQLVPPILRDSRWFMYLPMRLVLKDSAHEFMNFKEWVFKESDEAYGALYERTGHVQELQGETDLNEACTQEILKTVKGKKVLEVGAGRGYLAGKLAPNNKVTASDIVINQKTKDKYKGSGIEFVEANAEHLPFKDNEFDVVITTHTLEHVKDLPATVAELKRVAKESLIIVVPKQRPYKYTFSLHTQFFPYHWSLQAAFGHVPGKTTIKELDRDWFYHQDLTPETSND